MEFKDIMTVREYQKDGETKKVWMKVGTLKTLQNGKQFIDLHMHPDTTFFVFDKRDDNQQQPQQQPGF